MVLWRGRLRPSSSRALAAHAAPPDPPLLLPPWQAVALPACAFVANGRGYPVLPRSHQPFVLALLERGAQLLLPTNQACEPEPDACATEAAGGARPPPPPSHPRAYWEYACFLCAKARPPPSAALLAEAPFFDLLQLPLQPLAEQLEAALYAAFEQDPVK